MIYLFRCCYNTVWYFSYLLWLQWSSWWRCCLGHSNKNFSDDDDDDCINTFTYYRSTFKRRALLSQSCWSSGLSMSVHFCTTDWVSNGVRCNRLCGAGVRCAAMTLTVKRTNETAVKVYRPVQPISKFRKEAVCWDARCVMCQFTMTDNKINSIWLTFFV